MKQLGKEIEVMVDQLQLGEKELQTWIRKSKNFQKITRLPGDASTRRYYRVFSKKETFILMKMDAFEKEGAQLPFLQIQNHLERNAVPVPKVYDFEPKKGYILLEDLGDHTLLSHLQSVADRDVEREIYERVLDLLIHFQVHTGPKKQSGKMVERIPSFELRFDFEKLFWEIGFTIEHFYETYLERKITPKDRKIIEKRFKSICTELEKEPLVYVHRDFHSRNIMVQKTPRGGPRLTMIDFQDARMGPAQYDLVSILKDSYYQLDEVQVKALCHYYYDRAKKQGLRVGDRAHFERIFDLMSVQRNFKAIGSFASFLNRRGNPAYLKFIGNTFENIRRTLLRYPEFSDLREVLFHYYYF